MKKNKIKYVLIPAFAAATLFPVISNDNQAKASDDKVTTSSNITTNEKPTSVDTTANNVVPTATNTTANDVTASTTNSEPENNKNNEPANSTDVENKESTKPTIPFTVAEYKQKSALELAKLIREKKVTSTELVDLAYKVISEENPKLNAVLTTENGKIPNALVDEAYKTAKEIDDRIKAGNLAANPINWEEQPFLGVPTLIKGLDQVKDGDASNGVYFNKGKVSKFSGAVAKEFAKLGFVILGQTNYPELGTRNITDSKLFGPAGNPWDPSRNTGGSSGGSAGAVASGMVSIASGSDAGGSIRIPASWTGLIGLKPTGHVVKFPLVKTIEDAKTYFDKTQISKPKTLEEVPTDLKKLKIAYSLKTPLKDVELSEDGKKAVLKAVDFLRKQGFTVEEVNEFPINGYEGIRTYTIGAIGGAYTVPAKTATEENKRDLDPATYALGTSSTRGKTANTDVTSAKPVAEYINQMNEFYKKYDLFLMATNAVTAPSNDKKIDPYVNPTVEEKLYNINKIKDPKERFDLLVKQWEPMMRRTPFTWLFNLTGNPAISLPVYKSENNLPLGVMFAGRNNSEKILLEMGQLFQNNNQFILHPDVRNTVTPENGNKVRENEYGTKYEYSVPSDSPVAEALKPFTGKVDGLSVNGNKVVVDKDGNVSEYSLPTDSPASEALKPFTGKVDGLSENGNKVVVDKDGNISEYSLPTNAPVSEELKPFTGKIDSLSENGNKVVVDKDGNISEYSLPTDAPVSNELKPFIGKIDGLSENSNKVVIDKNGNISEYSLPTNAPVSEELKPFTGKIDDLSENGNKVVVDKDGNISEYSLPTDTPVSEELKPFTGKIDGLSENANKVVIDKDGNISEYSLPSDAPAYDAPKPFTGKVDSLSENGNKVTVDKDGNVSEVNVPSDTPIVSELPELNINNNTVTVTIKSKDKGISVDLYSTDNKDLTLSAKDITKDVNLENLKDKIIADTNNNINDKKDITSIRVVDLGLQKDNKTVKLDVPRTVKVALLQNEQNKDIFVYHIKEDNSIELVPSSVANNSLQFTVNHFSKFAIIAKIKTALASSEKDINSSAVQEEKKFTVIDTRGANSTPTNKPKTLPKTGETTNKSLTVIGLSFLAIIGLLKRRKNN